MERGKKVNKLFGDRNKMFLDLKDIVREHALHYLPAKSLFRCPAVCRDWKNQTSTPFFVHNQAYSFRAISGFFLQSQANPPSFVSLEQMTYGVPDPSLSFLPEPVQLRSSSNGLLCCQGTTGDKPYYICNPVNKKWKKIPKPESDHGSEPHIVLIFEPSLLNFVAEYTLVCAFPSELDGYEFEIYSSVNETWRVSCEIFYTDRVIQPKSGIYVNGVIYWRLRNGSTIAFDLKKERVRFLQGDRGLCLGSVNGKLCAGFVQNSRLGIDVLSNAYTNTMQMYSQLKGWEQKLDFTLEPSSTGPGTVLFLNSDVVVFQQGGSLYSYDLKTKSKTTLLEFFCMQTILVPYVNSLVEI